MSGLKVGRCFSWKTGFFDVKRSSDFRVGNCEWYLAINIRSEASRKEFEVRICPKQIQDTPFRPFKFTCFYKQGESSCPYGLLSKEIRSPTEHGLWGFGALFETLTFVFVFDEDISLELRTESGKELPVSDSNVSDSHDPDSDVYCLSSLSSDLGALLTSGDSSDVKLKTESGIRSAHRSVLACRSEVFSAMFRSDMKESKSGLVDIKDMDGTVFDLFLEYIYTGKIPPNLDEDTLTRLYSAADKYAVHSLKKHCGSVLSRSVTQGNHQALLVLADAHSDEWLKSVIIKTILEKPDWVKCEAWQQFSKQHSVLANEVLLRIINNNL